MPNANKVIIIGHLTRDIQMKFLANQTAIAEFGIATSRKFTTGSGEKKEETAFVDCVCFGKSAETLNQYTGKGKPLYIEGRLKYDTWEDKNGGGKRSKLSVIVEQFQFLNSREGSGESPESAAPQRQPSRGPSQRPAQKEPPYGSEKQFEESDIPFLWSDQRTPL